TLMGWIVAPVIPLIYGSDFAGSVTPFRVLVPGLCLLGGARVLSVYFSGHLARPDIAAWINWIGVVCQVVACVALSMWLGPLPGITWGTTLTCALTVLMFGGMFVRRSETPPWTELF